GPYYSKLSEGILCALRAMMEVGQDPERKQQAAFQEDEETVEAAMQKQHRAIIIQSPHAGRAMLLSQALTLLEQAGVEVARVLSIAALDSLPPQGALWQEQGMTLAIAAGGDGGVGGVITHLAAGRLP